MSKREDIDKLDAEVGSLSDDVEDVVGALDDIIEAVALLADNHDVAVKSLRRLADINELLTKRVAKLEARNRVADEINYHSNVAPYFRLSYGPKWEPWTITCDSTTTGTRYAP